MVLRITLILVLFFITQRFLPVIVKKLLPDSLSAHTRSLTIKSFGYGLTGLFLVIILDQFGLNLTAVLGTAGVLGVAIGFASQSSLSNIICGLFLLSEKPFGVGDVIAVGSVSGVVHSFDLISVKVRTFDNKLIRIPNESIFKQEVTNVTRFPLRRMNFKVGVAYKEDIRRVTEILKTVIRANPYCLDDPEPLLFMDEFGSSSMDFVIGVWFFNENYMKVKKSLLVEIKEAFDREHIEIPFPHMAIQISETPNLFPFKP
jgi:small-conductance mechanosensitive channel